MSIKFHIYEHDATDPDNKTAEGNRHLSWIGKYTFGCVMIRGISINLFSEFGEIWDYDFWIIDDDNVFVKDEPEKDTDLSKLPSREYEFRCDGHSFRIGNLMK
jgi:hypothetical protein